MLLCADAESARAAVAGPRVPVVRPRPSRPVGPRPRARRPAAAASVPWPLRRGRCRSCGATDLLLPSWMAPRRADGTGVIARAAAAAALHGAGSARLGAELGVPPATGGAARRCARAGDLRQDATAALGLLTAGRDWPCLAPCGSPSAMPWPRSSRGAGCDRLPRPRRGGSRLPPGRFGIAAALAPAPGS